MLHQWTRLRTLLPSFKARYSCALCTISFLALTVALSLRPTDVQRQRLGANENYRDAISSSISRRNAAVEELAHAALSVFRSYGKVTARPSQLGHACEWVQYVNNTLYISEAVEDDREFILFRRQSLLKLINEALNDTENQPTIFEFQLCLGDLAVSINHSHPAPTKMYHYQILEDPVPALSVINCDGSAQIAFPTWEHNDGEFEDWAATQDEHRAFRDWIPYSMRLDRAVFRGGERTCSLGADDRGWGGANHHSTVSTWKTCGRTGLMYSTLAHHPELYDTALSDTGGKSFHWHESEMDSRLWSWQKTRISLGEQEFYKAVIYMGGHMQWATRLKRLLLMGTVLIYTASSCREFYALGLRPWVHYVPVTHSLSNLSEAVSWVLTHEKESMQMIAAMHRYADDVLSVQGIREYARQVLVGLSEQISYKPALNTSFVPYDSRKRLVVYILTLSDHPLGEHRSLILQQKMSELGYTVKAFPCIGATAGNNQCVGAFSEIIRDILATPRTDGLLLHSNSDLPLAVAQKIDRVLAMTAPRSVDIVLLGCKSNRAVADKIGLAAQAVPLGHSCRNSSEAVITRQGAKKLLSSNKHEVTSSWHDFKINFHYGNEVDARTAHPPIFK